MPTPVKAQPDGYHAITPYLIVKRAAQAIEFYKQAFGAQVIFSMPQPDGRIGHAELKIGDSVIMMADEFPEMENVGPQTLGNTTVGILLYVSDCDGVFAKAVALGSKVKKPLADQFYGDRNGTLEDPFGHKWTIATHKEDVSPEEMQRRVAAMAK
jgi:PhnB protein